MAHTSDEVGFPREQAADVDTDTLTAFEADAQDTAMATVDRVETAQGGEKKDRYAQPRYASTSQVFSVFFLRALCGPGSLPSAVGAAARLLFPANGRSRRGFQVLHIEPGIETHHPRSCVDAVSVVELMLGFHVRPGT